MNHVLDTYTSMDRDIPRTLLFLIDSPSNPLGNPGELALPLECLQNLTTSLCLYCHFHGPNHHHHSPLDYFNRLLPSLLFPWCLLQHILYTASSSSGDVLSQIMSFSCSRGSHDFPSLVERPYFLLIPWNPLQLHYLLIVFWPLQACSCLRPFALFVPSFWNALSQDICMAHIQPSSPSNICLNATLVDWILWKADSEVMFGMKDVN